MVVKIVRRILQSYELNTVSEVEDMGFMVGKSSAKPSFRGGMRVFPKCNARISAAHYYSRYLFSMHAPFD
jgi:hypothetical protein